MNKITTAKEAVSHIKDGCVLMVGGFLQGGSPEMLLQTLLEESDAKDLTIINNDTGFDHMNTAKLQDAGRVKKVYATYIGGNKRTGQMFIDDPESVMLVPQGNMAEAIRAAGNGIPAFLTPVGVGTMVADRMKTTVYEGREYIIQPAMYGDVAIVHANIVDEFGNCHMTGTNKNFNVLMPAACKYCIVEAEKVVPVGELDHELINVSGVFVNAIVKL